MPGPRSWTNEELIAAVKVSYSIRAVIKALGLVPAGGNYEQVQNRMESLHLSTVHFTGKGWNVGLKFNPQPAQPLEKVLVRNSRYQTHTLKKRLFLEGLKKAECELCGWAEKSSDGRIPVELDHMNGDHYDNRLENLRILCPNCHNLQPTHRGRNKKIKLVKLRISAGAGTR